MASWRCIKFSRRLLQKRRYLDPPTLTTLGLNNDTDALLMGLHIEHFTCSRWPTYEKVVLEFISTLELITIGKKKVNDVVLAIRFCLGDELYEKLSAWVNRVYGFRARGPQLEQVEFTRDVKPFLLILSGLRGVEFRTTKVSTVHNPVF
ncbi:hypothetical protein Droror1_Dr00020458 [Drosera rotundifolia]